MYAKTRVFIQISPNFVPKRLINNDAALAHHWSEVICVIVISRLSWYKKTHTQHILADTLQWRHNERDGVSNRRRPHCLLTCWFRRRWKKTSKLRVTGAGNSPVTGEFPAQKASYAENVSIWWCHHETCDANCGIRTYTQSQTDGQCKLIYERCSKSNYKHVYGLNLLW